MYVHPKTVRYRVGRIREEYGIDVHATDDMMQVLLADKLIALLGPDWEPELNER
ncbi:PucR family transcriptional regulator [Olsenella umbonata]|uniref:PucR family transcriptional regulator n=1 Tax=Parafannyhessea umbonata TaxID=604330 RepID=A0A6N7X7P4_9ACTN|nr:PucR family transcriptional regulator [Parafannyhessea umbonata]